MAFHFGNIPGRVGRVNYGVVFNMANCRDGFDYLSGIEVSSLSGLPSDFNHETIPAQGYVVFSHREHVSKLKETVNAIWQEWLPASGSVVAHTIPDAPDMIEYYGENFDPHTGTGDIEIWIPVRE
jgi:AraC family transcriptional regulator